MPRSVNHVASKARRTRILKLTKGYFGARKNVWTVAKNTWEKGLTYAYRDRRNKKRNFRSLWIQRINAAARLENMTYSTLMGALHKAGIEINRKVLADKMYSALLIIYLVVSIALIAFILLQQGKGADAGASFGGGASGTVFGSAGAGNFLSRTTAVLAIIFFVISIVIGNINSHKNNAKQGAFDDLSGTAEQIQQQQQKAPVVLDTKNSDIPQQ